MIRSALIILGLGLMIWALMDDYTIGGGPGFGSFQLLMLVVGVGCIGASWLRKDLALSALIAIVTGLICVAAGELFLRVAVGEKFAAAYELHDRYIYRLKAGSVKEYTHLPINGGGSHTYRTNEHGYRGEELLVPAPDMRVAVFGDSFIQAIYSELGNTFTEQLERELDTLCCKDVEVVNGGVAGYGPDQVLRRLEDELALLAPNLLVVGIYTGNDFGDLVRNKLYRLDAQGALLESAYQLDSDIEYSAHLSEKEFVFRKLIRSAIEKPDGESLSRDPQAAIRLALEQQLREYREYVDQDNVVRELRSDPYSADISLLPESDSAELKLSMMRAVMVAIQVLASKLEIPVLFLAIPHPIDVMGGVHESGAIDREEYVNYDPDRLVRSITDICEMNKLTCFDLMSTMREEGGADLYLRGGDDHWNDRGQSVAAGAVGRFIVSEGHLLPGALKVERSSVEQ